MKAARLSAIAAIAFACARAQDIPNPSFENWTDGGLLGTYPDGYITTNGATEDWPTYGISETSDAYVGNSAAQIVTGHLYSTFIVIVDDTAGQLMSGWYQVLQQREHLGFPYTQRPAALRCHYKFFPMAPVGQDTGRILAAFFKYNGGRDTMGIAELKLTDTVDTYTQADIPITWSSQEVPDSAHISLESSLTWMSFGYAGLEGTGSHNPILGTKLIVDDLEFVMPVPVHGGPERMVPNDARGSVASSRLFDLRGRAVARTNARRPRMGAYVQVETRGLGDASLHLDR
jgi:hypothetical protein